jgi:hypothetical protein
MAPAAPPTRERAREELTRIFQRPEFQPPSRYDPFAWLRELLNAFVRLVASIQNASAPVFWAVLLGCVVVLVLLVGHIIWTLSRVLYVPRHLHARTDVATQSRRRAAAYRADADRAAEAGDFTEAVRCLFLSLVHLFDENGRFLFRAALTNREYLGQVAARPAVQDQLRVFVDLLDANWYGQRPTESAQYHTCLDLYQRVRLEA